MQKQFNDSIIYVRNGKPLPAIVLASQATAEGELLTLLYADPVNGPQLLAQGTTRGIAQVQQAVAPFVEGNMFGWTDGYPQTEAGEAPKTPLAPSPMTDEDVYQGIKLFLAKEQNGKEYIYAPDNIPQLQVQIDKAMERIRAEEAPEQLDEAQGPVTPGAPESPHSIEPIMPTDPTSFESVEAAKAAALAAENPESKPE